MADYKGTDTELTSVANAIRQKGGTSSLLTWPSDFVSAINAIEGGDLPDLDVIAKSRMISCGSNYVNKRGVNSSQTPFFYYKEGYGDYYINSYQGANATSSIDKAIPKDYKYLVFDVQSSGRSSSYNLSTLYLTDDYGTTGDYGGNFLGTIIKSFGFVNYSWGSAEARYSQNGITFQYQNDDKYSLQRQLVVVDISNINQDVFVSWHRCDNTTKIYRLIATNTPSEYLSSFVAA